MRDVNTGRERYTHVAILLHWAIAAFILFNLTLGFFMEGFAPPVKGIVIPIHVSAGISVLMLTVARVVWRLTHEPPPYPDGMPRWERQTAHIVHFLLYAAMVLMPLTGWAIISAHPAEGTPGAAAAAAAHGAPAPGGPAAAPRRPGSAGHKLWWVIPLPAIAPIADIGATPGGVAPQEALHETVTHAHGLGGFILIALLLLHVAGALKHQFIDRQAELARMGIGRRLPVHEATPNG